MAASKRIIHSTKSKSKSPARKICARSKGSKIDRVIAALRTPKGATIHDLMSLTGWQMHSVRGAIAGALKKRRGLNVVSEKRGDERVYRIQGKA